MKLHLTWVVYRIVYMTSVEMVVHQMVCRIPSLGNPLATVYILSVKTFQILQLKKLEEIKVRFEL